MDKVEVSDDLDVSQAQTGYIQNLLPFELDRPVLPATRTTFWWLLS